MTTFVKELETLINKHSKEKLTLPSAYILDSTPDYILANYLGSCLSVFINTVRERDEWYDFDSCIKPTKGIGG